VAGEAENGLEALKLCKSIHPDVVLMDIAMPVLSGIQATAEILRHCPKTKVAILSTHDHEAYVVEAIRAGAIGYISKACSHADLLEAIKTVSKGGSYLSPQASACLVSRIRTGGDTPQVPLNGLSPRELQVLGLITDGKASKEIAVLLDLTLQTVKGYRKTLMKKLRATNVAGLINAGGDYLKAEVGGSLR
jgi:DNA-binding NarL/FixJ family response regulator